MSHDIHFRVNMPHLRDGALHHHHQAQPNFSETEIQFIVAEVQKRFKAELDKLMKRIEQDLQRYINRL
jgi:hypothetical protein